jgi:hypothetical protein
LLKDLRMKSARTIWVAGLILLFVAIINVAFALLVKGFGYDDILREPAALILTRFDAGGESLILIWLTFAVGCLLFVPIALLLPGELGVASRGGVSATAALGVTSSVLQAIGLLRWVFVVPVLAASYLSADASEASRAAALSNFQLVHHYGGVVVGEFLGQVFLTAWTIGTCAALLRSGPTLRWLGRAGLLTVPLWILGFSELLATVMPSVASLEMAPVAFMAWEAWLAGVAIALLAQALKDRRLSPSAPAVATTPAAR